MAKQLALFGLMTALWALNWFPIQRAEKILSATAVVSGQRLPSLQRLSKQVRLSSDSIRWVHYTRDLRRSSGDNAVGGIEHIYLRLGVLSGASYEQIQRELVRLTEPSTESFQAPRDLIEVRSERWKLATIEHQMALFELDRAREKNSQRDDSQRDDSQQDDSQQDDSQRDESSGDQDSSTKASAVVYRKLNAQTESEPASQVPHRATWESLLTKFDQSAKRIEGFESQLAKQRLEASGTIAITGSPRMGVMSTRASVPETLCVIAFTTISCFGLSFCLRRQVPTRLSGPRGPRGVDSATMLNRMGMQHLGSIAIELPSEISIGAANRVPEFASAKSPGLSDIKRIWVTRRIVDALMVVWLGLFAFRFLSDANWRELLFSTPLSAFSSMLLGAY
jgi:hypothetical protein